LPALAAAIAIPLVIVASTGSAQDRPVLAGTWTLNEEKTEEPRDRTIEDVASTGSRTPTGLGGRGGSGARSAGGSTIGNARGSRTAFGLMFGGMMRASRQLKITQADSVILIEDEDGPLFVNLRADGKTLEQPLADHTVLKTKAQWRRTDLVIERTHDVQGSARMTIKVDPKYPKVMSVEFHYEHKRERRTIDQKRIYDAGV
jgi:outer membrane lipoprotein SlyB